MDFRQDQGKGRDREQDRRTLLAAIGVGALWGSGAGLLIATKGTGQVRRCAGRSLERDRLGLDPTTA